MPTLRDAIQSASQALNEEVSADIVKRVKQNSGAVALRLKESYDDFFQILHERVLNDPSMENAGISNLPAIFRNSGVAMRPWFRVSDKWFKEKEKAQKAGDSRALGFYHGVTYSLLGAGFSRKNKKGKFKRKRSRLTFDQFSQSLAMGGGSVTQGFFGPLTVSYSMTRPDKGRVQIKQIDDAITILRQWHGKGYGSGFAPAMSGTVIKATVTAFPKVDGFTSERTLIDYMIGKGGNQEQWVKVVGNRNRNARVRAILLPLINWYTKVNFQLIMEDILE